jgi:hypothetical protein
MKQGVSIDDVIISQLRDKFVLQLWRRAGVVEAGVIKARKRWRKVKSLKSAVSMLKVSKPQAEIQTKNPLAVADVSADAAAVDLTTADEALNSSWGGTNSLPGHGLMSDSMVTKAATTTTTTTTTTTAAATTTTSSLVEAARKRLLHRQREVGLLLVKAGEYARAGDPRGSRERDAGWC